MHVYVCLGRLAFVKMYNNFLQVVVLLKNAVLWISFVQMGSFGVKKKYRLFALGFYGPVNNVVMSSRSVNSGTVHGQA